MKTTILNTKKTGIAIHHGNEGAEALAEKMQIIAGAAIEIHEAAQTLNLICQSNVMTEPAEDLSCESVEELRGAIQMLRRTFSESAATIYQATND